MPSHESGSRALFKPVENLGSRLGVWVSVQSDVDEDVRVEKYQRYFLASASYLGSSRPAALNRPRHLWVKEVLSRPATALSESAAG
jgi:hypothetical protein